MPAEASSSLKLTFALIDAMLEDAAIDKNRIYITGLSMGGYGTWTPSLVGRIFLLLPFQFAVAEIQQPLRKLRTFPSGASMAIRIKP